MSVAVVVVGLSLWQLRAHQHAINPIFFPAPSEIAQQLKDSILHDGMLSDLGLTLKLVAIGVVLGGSIGLVVGLAMGWSRTVRGALDPLVAAVHPIPKVALFPLFLVIFGIGDSAKVAMTSAAAFFPMVLSAMAGVRQISPAHYEVAQSYGLGRRRVITAVVLPGSLPMVMTGVRLAVNTAMLVAVAVELVLGTEGIGGRVWFAWQTLRTPDLYASLVVIAITGVLLNRGLDLVRTRLVPWDAESER